MFLTLVLINLEGVDMSVADILGIIGLVVAFIVGLGGLIKAIKEIRENGWTPTKDKFKGWLNRRKRDRVLLNEMSATINRIDGQLTTNGGSSVKDAVMRIDGKMEYIQARLRNQDETAAHAIFDLDASGDMTITNCAFRELVNADDQELLYRKYISRVHPDDRSRLLVDIDQAIKNAMPLDTNVRFRTGATSFVAVRMIANPDVRSGGKLMGFFGTASQLTQ